MKTYLVLTSVLFAAYAAGATGCAESCTAIGCSYPLSISVTSKSWLTGDYEVGLTTPERAFTCSLSVPRDNAGAAGQGGVSTATATCTQTAGAVSEQGEFPTVYFAHGFSIYLSWAASEVELTLHYDGQELLDERLTPNYTESYPNGRECDANPCLNYDVTLEARSPTAA